MVGAGIVLTIAGNKVDLERERTVPKETAQEYAASVGAHYDETSAKTGRGIDEVPPRTASSHPLTRGSAATAARTDAPPRVARARCRRPESAACPQVFGAMARKLLEGSRGGPAQGAAPGRRVLVADEPAEPPRKQGGCC